jgi:hypothetical protein
MFPPSHTSPKLGSDIPFPQVGTVINAEQIDP